MSVLADWVSLIQQSQQMHGRNVYVLVLQDFGGTLVDDNDVVKFCQVRVLPPDTRPASQHHRPETVVPKPDPQNLSDKQQGGFLVFQSCQVHESTMEFPTSGDPWQGAMTRFLLSTWQMDNFRNLSSRTCVITSLPKMSLWKDSPPIIHNMSKYAEMLPFLCPSCKP